MSSSLLKNTLHATLAAIASVTLTATAITMVHAQAADPRAQITLPAADQTVHGTVAVQGTATSPFFSRYEMAFAPEPEATNWVSLGGNVQMVDNGTLGVWNTRPLTDGQYALRLQVFNSDGSVTEAIARNITLANADAVAPAPAVVITDTTQGPAVVAEVQSARNTIQVVAATLSELPDAFIRGARLALLAFVALGAYVLIKKLVLYGLHRAARRPVDYGK